MRHVGVTHVNTPIPLETKMVTCDYLRGNACQAVWLAGTRYRFVWTNVIRNIWIIMAWLYISRIHCLHSSSSPSPSALTLCRSAMSHEHESAIRYDSLWLALLVTRELSRGITLWSHYKYNATRIELSASFHNVISYGCIYFIDYMSETLYVSETFLTLE